MEKKVVSTSPGATAPAGAVFEAVETLLRGLGQVMFQDSEAAGALFFAGLFHASPLVAWAAVVGAASSTLAALAFGADRAQVRAGLFGYNGALVGIALVVFLEPSATLWLYLVAAAAFSSLLTTAIGNAGKPWKASALTSPFVLTAWAFLLAAPSLEKLSPAATAPPSSPTLVAALFTGVSQVFLVNDVVAGVLIVAGLAVVSRRAAAMAMVGSLVGLLVGLGLGASESDLGRGLWGFSPCLTALALGATPVVSRQRSIGLVVFGAAVTAIVAAAMTEALRPMGMVALTAPFVLVVWAFTLADAFGSPESDEARR